VCRRVGRRPRLAPPQPRDPDLLNVTNEVEGPI